ncbi:DUF6463 family protein [Phytomonospora sp. NPDC050363]|uniref:DUF6463 family protein n=1 Tax=Phytomonospora sp. NPDC050363 TaxID=3155642 RepID=UPI00340F4D2A
MRASRKVVWAGGILLALGVLHLASTLVISADHLPGWFARELWLSGESEMSMSALPPEAGAFWLSLGSFGLPLLLLGALVVRLGRRGEAPPAYVGWGVGVWGALGAYLLEPTPFVLTLIPATLLLVAAYKTAAYKTAPPKTSPTT